MVRKTKAIPIDDAAWLALERELAEGRAERDDGPLGPYLREWDARRFAGETLAGRVPPIFRLRSLVFRGDFAEAERLAVDLSSTVAFDDAATELALERARLAVVRGDWKTSRALLATLALAPMAPLSRLTCFQLLALTSFECGELEPAQRALERAESLASIYPDCSAALYARLIELRIVARRQGPAPARARLRELWRARLAEGRLDRNTVQALLRTEVDLGRLAGEPHFRAALGALVLAESMGERLYIGLGYFDCFHAGGSHWRREFGSRLAEAAAEFPRISSLIEQVARPEEFCSVSAQAILAQGREIEPDVIPRGRTRHLILSHAGAVMEVASGSCMDLGRYPQLARAIGLLEPGPRSKESFFHSLWGRQKYVPRLHDNLIYAVLHRLKSKLRISSRIADGAISMPEVLAI